MSFVVFVAFTFAPQQHRISKKAQINKYKSFKNVTEQNITLLMEQQIKLDQVCGGFFGVNFPKNPLGLWVPFMPRCLNPDLCANR